MRPLCPWREAVSCTFCAFCPPAVASREGWWPILPNAFLQEPAEEAEAGPFRLTQSPPRVFSHEGTHGTQRGASCAFCASCLPAVALREGWWLNLRMVLWPQKSTISHKNRPVCFGAFLSLFVANPPLRPLCPWREARLVANPSECFFTGARRGSRGESDWPHAKVQPSLWELWLAGRQGRQGNPPFATIVPVA